MIIQDLKIENFRCYDFAEITFDKGINLIHGQNGCGKSSLIEAIQLNLSGKSFRTTEIDTIIRKNNSFLQSLVTFEDNKGIKITKERDKRAKITDIESKKSKNYKFLVENYPLCLVENNEFFFTDANPETKRVFLNKTLFYVEQNFNFTENILKKIIKSRSNCLKHQKFDEINYWNDKLVEIEPQITESCTKIIDRFNHEIKNNTYVEVFSEKNGWIKDISLGFNPGFNKNTPFKDVLLENLSKDKALCRTSSGPHKRFFKINVHDTDASLILSRGQQKIASIVLHLVQREIIKNDTGISPILLMDDISSELDKDNANLMLKYLINNSIQTIMTSIENNHFFNTDGVCMFHVEQIGDLSNVR